MVYSTTYIKYGNEFSQLKDISPCWDCGMLLVKNKMVIYEGYV